MQGLVFFRHLDVRRFAVEVPVLWRVLLTGKALLITVRPRQWVKNLVVLAAIVFSGKLSGPGSGPAIVHAAMTFAAFCLACGAQYLVNDLLDRDSDRRHPLKRLRPIAAGQLQPREAIAAALVLGAIALVLAFLVNTRTGLVLLGYTAITLAYSVGLKHVVVMDVFVISLGFVLRAVAGATAVSVQPSAWLLICTMLLALFLALSKRRHELVVMEGNSTAPTRRPVLDEYSPRLLDQMIAVVTSSTVVAYALYTLDERTIREVGTRYLGFTIPFVLYGIFRYLYLVYKKEHGGSPEKSLLADKPLLLAVVLWAVVAYLTVYLTGG